MKPRLVLLVSNAFFFELNVANGYTVLALIHAVATAGLWLAIMNDLSQARKERDSAH